ncbi:MAG: sigma-70 family RNA polymerase sigma factor [Saprospirales bacterium]|nr:sigma-70 family RNA polymerase sigma factor [Saprospirales bacterium]
MLAAFLASATLEPTGNQRPQLPVALSPQTRQRPGHFSQEAEAALIQQAISGAPSACAALVRRYDRMVFGLAFQILGNREDALEATQDAFLKAFRFLSGYRGDSRFSTWLYRIARTSAINYLRKARRQTMALDAPGSPVRHMPTVAFNGLEAVMSGERAGMLRSALRMLLPDDSAVLTLFYLQEQSLEEICEIMGWTMSNAKSRLCRARQRLRVVLLEHFADEFAEWV